MTYKICLTNDDGPNSTGLQRLASIIAKEFDLVVVVPEGQRSATGKSLTLNTPLRVVKRKKMDGIELYTHTGTPADSVIVAKSLFKDIDLFVSGINPGANLGYQSMLTSGTVGAAFEAAFSGYPAISISRVVNSDEWFTPTEIEGDFTRICEVSMDIIRRIKEKGLPEGIDALNLNFPKKLADGFVIAVSKPMRVRIANEMDKRVDPHNSPYYWISGTEVEPSPGTDAYDVFKNGNVSLAPIVIETIRDYEVERVKEFMSD
ncbi:MAG: 5'/3'-nucleotidase SurE [Candidatus Thorarchaeota archaeon]